VPGSLIETACCVLTDCVVLRRKRHDRQGRTAVGGSWNMESKRRSGLPTADRNENRVMSLHHRGHCAQFVHDLI